MAPVPPSSFASTRLKWLITIALGLRETAQRAVKRGEESGNLWLGRNLGGESRPLELH